MKRTGQAVSVVFAALCAALTGCGGSGGAPPTTYVLTVDSTGPSTGVAIGVSPADTSGTSAGTTSFTLTYDSGATVTLTAPATVGSGASETSFSKWTGCTSTSGNTCNVSVSANATVTANYAPATFTLTVASTGAPAPVAMMAAPADVNGATSVNSGSKLTYTAGTAVTLTAPQITVSGNNSASFVSMTGCTSVSGESCYVTMDANTTVTAAYAANLVTILPYPASATIGSTLQFSAAVNDPATTNQAVTWSVAGPSGWSGSAGDFSGSGLYTTPYPAPTTVMVTATSVGDPGASLTIPVTLTAPPAANGPALTVDLGTPTHPINPFIYGMNGFELSPSILKPGGITIDRFGGDGTQRYNYLIDAWNVGSDYEFVNQTYGTGVEATNQVNLQVESDEAAGAKSLVTVDVMGWIAKDGTSCSFPTSLYPDQYQINQWIPCGDGELPNQTDITGNDPTLTSFAITPDGFTKTWLQYLTAKFGNAASGGIDIYELDNEPAWWDGVHRDVHPVASTYDEVTNNGIEVAKTVKSVDPTAAVSGPVIDYWWNYFYSKADIESGWHTGGPCYSPWSNPIDRNAHGGIPMVEYYLQQMKSASTTYGARLLDYLDLHTYYAASYQGNPTSFTTAGDTGEQQARINSTRAFWDPTYTDPTLPQPNYSTDANYTSSCNVPLQAPQIIPMMKQWVANDYPGTKTAITEYNWGGQESINGAIAQADLLGIFGREGLDMAMLWGAPDPVKQVPSLVAFEVYGNYDGAGSKFGDTALTSTSANQGQLAVYGAQRTADGAVTVIVLNKTYGGLTSTLSLPNLTATGSAQVYQYTSANLASLVALSPAVITAPASGSTTSSLTMNFPAQSITILVIPTK